MFDPDMFDTHHHMLDMAFNTSENELENVRDDDFEAKSGAEMLEEACGSDQQRSKKKRYNRHTQHQIQEMEACVTTKSKRLFFFFFFFKYLFLIFINYYVFDELSCFRFFKECPHPDDKQRMELSRELGLEPLQVKFWFQNKRTQMKVTSLNHPV